MREDNTIQPPLTPAITACLDSTVLTSGCSVRSSPRPITTPRCTSHTNCPPFPAEDLRHCRDDLEIGEVLRAALGTLGLFFFVLLIYSVYKKGPVDGFFEQNSPELDYYKRTYGW